MRKIRFLKAQSTAEYVILLAVVAGALIMMQVYVKRGIQGRIRNLADQISPTHYEPKVTDANYTITQSATLVRQYQAGIATTYQDPLIDLDADGQPDAPESTQETITRSGYEQVRPEE